MYINQQELTEKALFEYYMVGSVRESEVYSPFPYYLSKASFEDMRSSALILDGLVNRLLRRMLKEQVFDSVQFDSFPLLEDILGLKNELPSFFWTRFDAFEREDGGIFFSEFNYDKPCAQREIAMSNMMKPLNNINDKFNMNFADGFKSAWESFSKGEKTPNVAILVDSGHYEELHLAYLYMDLLKSLDYEFIIVGGKNLYIENEQVMAFGKKIDVILRQFPTEFTDEIDNFKDILRLYSEGRVLVLNDPRSIIAQSKSIFATLWTMAEENDPFLSEIESKTIKEKLPYTVIYAESMLEELKQNKDKYVIKASFGRFSEEVYIGKMHTDEEWLETLEYVSDCGKLHIVQEFCQIKKQRVHRFNGACYQETDAYANLGIYLVNGEFSGVCLRLSDDYLSLDENTWIGSVGIQDRTLNIKKYTQSDRAQKWDSINNYAAFEHGYTLGYTGHFESFTLDHLALDSGVYDELVQATQSMGAIFRKTRDYVLANLEIVCPVLGISDSLVELLRYEHTDRLAFIGRFDWVLDSFGHLKLLEFNSETPAGLMESLVLNPAIKEHLNIAAQDPNQNMKQMIRSAFLNIIDDYTKVKQINNIGFVSSTCGDDWYNTTILLDQLKDLPFCFELGEISGIAPRNGQLEIYQKGLDAVYRYYPLDWLDQDEYYSGVIDTFKEGTLSINPPSTIISQSKAFMALIYELRNNNFFSDSECNFIDTYIPRTYLAPKKFFNGIFCAKPFFEREGNSVAFSFKEPGLSKEIADYVFQEWVDIQGVSIDINSTIGTSKEIVYPVLGTYLIDNEFGGIYTRAGNRVTNKWAVYLPTYIDII